LFDSKPFSQIFSVRFDRILSPQKIYKRKKTSKRNGRQKKRKSIEERNLVLLQIHLGVSITTSKYQNIGMELQRAVHNLVALFTKDGINAQVNN